MISKRKKHYTYLSLGLFFLASLIWAGSSIAPRATAAPRISEEEAIAVATGGEIGPNDFRISDAGADRLSDASQPAVAYNSTDNEYLVVWKGDDVRGALADNEYEIYGQRVDAATGQEIGPNDFRISDVGPDGDSTYSARHPAVAYDPNLNRYLVVWHGDNDTDLLANHEYEIHGQLLRADGAEIGENDFRISVMGITVGNPDFYGVSPAVAFNSDENQYLVVWQGIEQLLVDLRVIEEHEVFGRMIAADGTLGDTELRISNTGPDGDLSYRAENPAVVYNPTTNQFLVLWNSNNDTGNLVQGKQEIFAQLLDASGAVIGEHIRVSTTGADDDPRLDSTIPAATYNPDLNQYLVVWQRDHTSVGNNDTRDEVEIYGQLLQADGTEIGSDFRISDMGLDGVEEFDAEYPAVTYNTIASQYLVVWDGDDNSGDLQEDHKEVFGQFLDVNGQEVGENDFRITYTGPDTDPDFDSVDPAVVYNPVSDQFFVVSESDVNVFGNQDEDEILGQLLTAAGDDAGMRDIRLSNMGADETYDALEPAVAYNSVDNEYLVVWAADDNLLQSVDDEFEIHGQRIDAVTGAEVGPNDFRISRMGPVLNPDYDVWTPAVAFNPDLNQYLVVWEGDDNSGMLVDEEFEIFGQLLNADGSETGADDFRISHMGDEGDAAYDAHHPAAVYNSLEKQYLVVWRGKDIDDDLSGREYEIFGQLLNADGSETGANDFRISDIGPAGDDFFNAFTPALAHNVVTNQYLVVWNGIDNATGTPEYETYGQLLDATGVEIGANDFRISDMGPDGYTDVLAYITTGANVVHNPTTNQYLVVWAGVDDASGLPENEIYGQLLQADGTETGVNDFRISKMGPEGDTSYAATRPAAAYDATANQYLVVWGADDNRGDLVLYEEEIFGQALLADGTETGENDFRLSDMGPDGDAAYLAERSAVACGSAGQCLIVWSGDDDTIPMVDDEYEIFGQLYASGTGAPPPPPPPPSSTHQIFLPLMTQ